MNQIEKITYPETNPEVATGLRSRLQVVRTRLGVSQQAMNELLFITDGSWQRYEAGHEVPDGGVLSALAIEGFNVNWVLHGVGPMEIAQ